MRFTVVCSLARVRDTYDGCPKRYKFKFMEFFFTVSLSNHRKDKENFFSYLMHSVLSQAASFKIYLSPFRQQFSAVAIALVPKFQLEKGPNLRHTVLLQGTLVSVTEECH